MTTIRDTLLSVDIGKATISFVKGELSANRDFQITTTGFERHLGDPVEAFEQLYRDIDHGSLLGVTATGVFADRLAEPVISEIPEEIAQEFATRMLYPDGPLNIVRLGGSGYSILTRDKDGRFRFEENDKCSAGTGETIEKICLRLGLSLEEAIELARGVENPIPITARCSVFAKSEMTHFANQGESHERLLGGYFESVARNIHSLYDKNKVEGPVILIGAGALIDPVVDALRSMIPGSVQVSECAGVYEAIGAFSYASSRDWDKDFEWPLDPACFIKTSEKRIKSLRPMSSASGSVTQLSKRALPENDQARLILGIDLGSTGAKAALIEAGTGRVVADFYRRTSGAPVEAAQALCESVLETCKREVVAIGLTGSGRDAAATVFRAAYPEDQARIIVQNEIVAHATAAIQYDPDGGKSLSIVEIGGQDAKFINVVGGRVLESDMNRACSAGTGSFLEEQAIFYGVDDITRFGEMAACSCKPPDLGQMCTVFVSDLAAEAVNEGYSLEDLFAGFQYSVIHNYKNRVMGNRQFMDRIFFQGKPASNPSLAQTLATITGREVCVPPNPGAMGAIGIAMLTAQTVGAIDSLAPLDFGRIIEARVTGRKTFQCRDSKCKNLCRIEKATVEVGGKSNRVFTGGACPKYESVHSGQYKLPNTAPNPFREREELLQTIISRIEDDGAQTGNGPGIFDGLLSSVKHNQSRPVVGIPYGHYMIDYLPYFHAFFNQLGARVKVIRSDSDTSETGNRRCSANNACTPVKIMHGLAESDVDFLFLPKFVEIPRLVRKSGASTCPLVQGTPEMIEHSLAAEGSQVKVLRPIFRMGDLGFQSPTFIKELHDCRQALADHMGIHGYSMIAFATACREALRRQQYFERELNKIGKRALTFAREKGVPVVLVIGNSHVIHEPIMNAGIHRLIATNGAVALPLDCFPIPDSIPALERVYWGTSNRLLRASLAAAEAGDVFPLLLISYGCGPSSFVEGFFNHLMEDYPHTVLESDGHGGQAGYVTRIQAFLHSARSFEKSESNDESREGSAAEETGYLTRIQAFLDSIRDYTKTGVNAVSNDKIALYNRMPLYTQEQICASKIITTSSDAVGGKQSTAILHGLGYEADYSVSGNDEAFRLGQGDCSGKECLPHQLIWGSYSKYLHDNPPAEGEKILFPNISGVEGPCRNGMFSLANEIAIQKLGYSDRVSSITSASFKNEPAVVYGKWLSMLGNDLLGLLRLYYRPEEKQAGKSDELFYHFSNLLAEQMVNLARDKGLREAMQNVARIEALMSEAAKAYHDMEKDRDVAKELRTVYLCGDMFLLGNEYGNDNLTLKLNNHGLRIMFQPVGDMIEFLMFHRSRELFDVETRPVLNYLVRNVMEYARDRMVASVSAIHPWVRWDGPAEIDRSCKELLNGAPFCEAMSTIGSSLLAWSTRPIDGVVASGPLGCGPSLIAEAQLRRRADIPALFIYHDGDPIDEARLAGFAWRLKNSHKRTIAPGRDRYSSEGSVIL